MTPLLPLPQCVEGVLLRRVKRFSVEFLYRGQRLWAHTNNSGAMMGLINPGCRARFSLSPNRARKLPYTLEQIQLPARMGGVWVGVNTRLPNELLAAAFAKGQLDFCVGYATFGREVRVGQSRIDGMCSGPHLPPLWIECKSVTLVEDDRAAFPDAASCRAAKHLKELMEMVKMGQRAAMFYVVQRPDGTCFGPADYIDPAYAELFHKAVNAGVEVYVRRAIWSESGIGLGEELPWRF